MLFTVLATFPCYVCDAPFAFDPETVPSVPVDPTTRQPALDGTLLPVCPPCVQWITEERRARGLQSWGDPQYPIPK